MITSMREHKGYLYLGGILNNRIGRYKLAGADPNWTRPDVLLGDKRHDSSIRLLDYLGRGKARHQCRRSTAR